MSLQSLVWVLGIWQPNDCPANPFWIILAYEPYGVTGVYPISTPLKGVSSSKRSGTYRTSRSRLHGELYDTLRNLFQSLPWIGWSKFINITCVPMQQRPQRAPSPTPITAPFVVPMHQVVESFLFGNNWTHPLLAFKDAPGNYEFASSKKRMYASKTKQIRDYQENWK